ncbi:MAG: hypothetical protein JW910_07210 [Anaerolineae bacterium]|nr:hypothetical protein [Anaerolineae bacterium]
MAENPNDRNAISSAVSGFVSRLGIIGELFQFLWARKLWWLIPMILALIIFALLIILGQASGAAPFIYTLF